MNYNNAPAVGEPVAPAPQPQQGTEFNPATGEPSQLSSGQLDRLSGFAPRQPQEQPAPPAPVQPVQQPVQPPVQPLQPETQPTPIAPTGTPPDGQPPVGAPQGQPVEQQQQVETEDDYDQEDDYFAVPTTPGKAPVWEEYMAKVPVDGDGNADEQEFLKMQGQYNKDFSDYTMNQARTEARRISQLTLRENQSWNSVEKQYNLDRRKPEDRETLTAIKLMREGEITRTGKDVSPMRAANLLFKLINRGKQQGVQQAQETTRVQASTHVETSGIQPNIRATDEAATRQRADSRDPAEATEGRVDVLTGWIQRGKIRT